jgi:CO dehydrogenase maturation factor
LALKLAVSGKGGVGKTTVAAGLCLSLADRGFEILALDCDPDSNLATALGFPQAILQTIRPLSAFVELIEERTGAKPGQFGAMFKLNPYVADIPDTHCYRHEPFRLLVMDGANKGGGGCDCPQNTLMKRLVSEVLVRRDEAVVMDMEAGLEHLGRGTAGSVNALLAIVEPGQRSVATAERAVGLATDLGIAHTMVVGNRFRDDDHLRNYLGKRFENILGNIVYDPGFVEADSLGEGIASHMGDTNRDTFRRFVATIQERCNDL